MFRAYMVKKTFKQIGWDDHEDEQYFTLQRDTQPALQKAVQKVLNKGSVSKGDLGIVLSSTEYELLKVEEVVTQEVTNPVPLSCF